MADNAAALAGNNSKYGTNDEATDFGEVLVWTMRETQPENVLKDVSRLDGKVVLDLNNRDYAKEAKNGAWFERAIAEQLQENAPGVRVVKMLNTVAMESLDTAPEELRAVGAQTFLAGADHSAKEIAGQLANDLGFEAIDLGQDASAFRAAEALGDIIRLL